MNGIRAMVNPGALLAASVWLGSAYLLTAPGTAAAAAADDAMTAEVPRVAERINILDERFEIEQIKVTGVVDRPQWDIRNSEINQLADELLADITDRQEIADRGFSEEEIDQILAKMLEIRNRSDDSQLGRVRLMNSLIRELDEMERERGLSIEEIEGIAGQIQAQYRDRGFLFARVIVPRAGSHGWGLDPGSS